jgi:hypothetical protein
MRVWIDAGNQAQSEEKMGTILALAGAVCIGFVTACFFGPIIGLCTGVMVAFFVGRSK